MKNLFIKLSSLIISLCYNYFELKSQNIIFYESGFEDVNTTVTRSYSAEKVLPSNNLDWRMINADIRRKTNTRPVISGINSFIGYLPANAATSDKIILNSGEINLGNNILNNISFTAKSITNNGFKMSIKIITESSITTIFNNDFKQDDNYNFIFNNLNITGSFNFLLEASPIFKQNNDRTLIIDDIIFSGSDYIPPVNKPIIENVKSDFAISRQVRITQDENKTIYYTIDGSIPDKNSLIFNDIINITQSCILKAVSYSDENERSEISEYEFKKIDPSSDFSTFFSSPLNTKLYFNVTDYIITYANDNFAFLQNKENAFIIKNMGLNTNHTLDGWFSGFFEEIDNIKVFIPNDIIDINITNPGNITPSRSYISNSELVPFNNLNISILSDIIFRVKNIDSKRYYLISQNNNNITAINILDSNLKPISLPSFSDIIYYPYMNNDLLTLIVPEKSFITDRTDEIKILLEPTLSIEPGTEENPTFVEYGQKIKIESSVKDVIFKNDKDEIIDDEIVINEPLQFIYTIATKDGYIESPIVSGYYSAQLSKPEIILPETFDNNTTLEIKSYPGANLYITINNENISAISPFKMKITESSKISCYSEINGITSPVNQKNSVKVDKYVMGVTYKNQFRAMNSILLKNAAQVSIIDIVNNEAIISSVNDFWNIISSSEGDKILSNQNNYLTANSTDTNLKLSSSSKYWRYKVYSNGDSSYCYDNYARYIKYSIGEEYFKYYTQTTVNYIGNLQRLKIGGAIISTNDSINNVGLNQILNNRYIKYIDLTNTLVTDTLKPIFSGNPNCLIFSNEKIYSKNNVYNARDSYECDTLILTDFEPFNNYKNFTCLYSEYSREAYKDGLWESIVLPFTVQENDMPDNFVFEKFHSATNDKLIFVKVNYIEANIPHIMRWTGEISNDKEMIKLTGRNNNILPMSTKNDDIIFIGSYLSKPTENDYILVADNGESLFGKGSSTSKVRPFRASIKVNNNLSLAKFKIEHSENLILENNLKNTYESLTISPLKDKMSVIINGLEDIELSIYDYSGRLIQIININKGETKEVFLGKGCFIINKTIIIF